MTKRFIIPAEMPIRWPPACVVCGSSNVVTGEAHGSRLTGLGWWGLGYSINYANATLAYPICRNHLYLARVLRFLYFASFVVLLFSGVFALSSEDRAEMPYAIAIFIIALLFFLYAALSAPVRVRAVANGDFVVNITNEIYAEAFSRLNAQIHQRVAKARAEAKERVRQSFGHKLGRYLGGLFRRH